MRAVGYHEYKPFPGVDRCSICLLVDGDCVSSPNADLTKEGHYLTDVEYPLIRVKMGDPVRDDEQGSKPGYSATYSSVEVYVDEADFYRVQGERDDMRRTLALINAEVWHPKGADMSVVKRLLKGAGFGKDEARSTQGVIAYIGQHQPDPGH